MFHGKYNFFDYKYNIVGYNGQDFGSISQYLYLVISIIFLIVLLILLRKTKKERVLNVIRWISLFMIFFYIAKTTWESIYDIKKFGSFNTYLLPLDSCSMIMFASLLAGFSKGKLKSLSESWICTGGIVGGIATMVILNALNYYPFFSFGAFYSMLWHFLMVFLGCLLIVTNYVELNYKLVLKGFLFHFLFSLIVIPVDFINNLDFMMYLNLGSIPFFEGIASSFTAHSLQFLNPIMMLLLYFIAFNVIFLVAILLKKLIGGLHGKKSISFN